jgi:predicted kinase
MKQLIIVRGLPGSGKSTFARQLAEWYRSEKVLEIEEQGFKFSGFTTPPVVWLESDQFRMDEKGEYKWTPENNKTAHGECKAATLEAMQQGVEVIIVSNTFTMRWEFADYLMMADDYGYDVNVIHMETMLSDQELANRNIHGVPVESIRRMRERWEPFSGA